MAREGILTQVAGFEIASIPIGAVAAGAVIGGVGDAVSGVVGGFAPQMPSWAVKGLLAWASIQWMPRLIGTQAAQLGGLFLTYDAVQELFNIRASVSNIVGGVVGRVVKASPARFAGAGGSKAKDLTGAGYYEQALGGS